MAKSQSSKVAPKSSSMKKVSVKKTGATLKKAANQKSDVKKKTLESLGNMTLNDKVKNALEKAGDDETAAAAMLKNTLTKVEHSRVWNQHNAARRTNPDIDDSLAKGRRRRAWLLHFDL